MSKAGTERTVKSNETPTLKYSLDINPIFFDFQTLNKSRGCQ